MVRSHHWGEHPGSGCRKNKAEDDDSRNQDPGIVLEGRPEKGQHAGAENHGLNQAVDE